MKLNHETKFGPLSNTHTLSMPSNITFAIAAKAEKAASRTSGVPSLRHCNI